MRVLSVDTATRVLSVAVIENRTLLAELTVNHGQTHSTHLMPAIDAVLEHCRLCFKQLDGFAVCVGPGSFTGLRIGLSTIKGLAFAVSKPIAAISALDALAYQFPCVSHTICPMIDARKGEVYSAGYSFVAGELSQLWPASVSTPEAAVGDISAPRLFVGSGALLYRDRISDIAGDLALFASDGQDYIRAATIAMLGHRLLARQQGRPPSALNPWYIRASDATRRLSASARKK
ncbi:MAG: tRNA (adenosine(37)-N6)-threonylcarbamoyltransferase complex dimerization subunit type 1 TsaB [Desulfobacterales bacterium]|nr:tRNA (adenosine(37)-N6)-threonylcarbamoyltransferase complex dimerization subunit type 1 TsaB [Desulfobacterales bacterium]